MEKNILSVLFLLFTSVSCITRDLLISEVGEDNYINVEWQQFFYAESPRNNLEVQLLGSDSFTGLWSIDLTPGILRYFSDPKQNSASLEEIQLASILRDTICSSEHIILLGGRRMEAFDPKTGELRSYDNEIGDLAVPFRCLVTDSGEVILLSRHWIGFYENWDLSIKIDISLSGFSSMALDPSGKLLLATYSNEIYSYDPMSQDFILYRSFDGFLLRRFLVTNDDVIWFATDDAFYRVDAGIDAAPELILKFNRHEHLSPRKLVQNSKGAVLLSTLKGLWKYENGDLEKIALPWGVDNIFSLDIDASGEVLYISSHPGVYYWDMSAAN